jgi:hypothetical protein
MQFEEAERLHQRVVRITEVQGLAGPLASSLERLHGAAISPCGEMDSVQVWFLLGGRWLEPRTLCLSETAGAGKSLDHRLREMAGELEPAGSPNLEHLAILVRWYGSSWRDGEWLGFDSLDRIPYRKLVNAVGRVAGRTLKAHR